jgi:hypothetical protein
MGTFPGTFFADVVVVKTDAGEFSGDGGTEGDVGEGMLFGFGDT